MHLVELQDVATTTTIWELQDTVARLRGIHKGIKGTGDLSCHHNLHLFPDYKGMI